MKVDQLMKRGCMGKLLSVNLLQRVLVALVGIPFLLWIIDFGGVGFFLFFSLLALLAVFEFHRLACHKAKPPALWIVLLITALFQANFYFKSQTWEVWEVWEVLLAVVLALLVMELFLKEGSPLLNLGAILPGLLYVNLSFGSLLRLRLFEGGGAKEGEIMVFLMFFCVWAADIFAYFGGSALGGRFIHRKLFERLSPHKTWEGFLSGLAGSVAASMIYSSFVPELSLTKALLTGLLIGLASPAGDLIESMFKRDAGVKDSSHLIPGHGGVLDRFDTIMFVSPFIYFITVHL